MQWIKLQENKNKVDKDNGDDEREKIWIAYASIYRLRVFWLLEMGDWMKLLEPAVAAAAPAIPSCDMIGALGLRACQ